MKPKLVAVVDADLLQKESWLTMIVGVLLINDGAKYMVRWCMWNPPVPFFGFETDPITSAILSVAIGLAEIYAGAAFLSMRYRGFWIALSLAALELISTILSWKLWDSFLAEMITNRQEYKGVPVDPAEIEFMQRVMPEMIIAWMVLVMALILVTWPRFRQKKH